MAVQAAQLVRVSYEQLTEQSGEGSSLAQAIEAAFGPHGLGIIVVEGVPGYTEARARLLPLAFRVASLPPATLATLEDPGSHYNFGWSHGRETLEGGRPGARAYLREQES